MIIIRSCVESPSRVNYFINDMIFFKFPIPPDKDDTSIVFDDANIVFGSFNVTIYVSAWPVFPSLFFTSFHSFHNVVHE